MRITADTNVLVRALVQDDPEQARSASALLEQAERVAISLPVLSELVWVLRRVYHFSNASCVSAIEALLASSSVAVDRPAVATGLKLLSAGGDFADGVIAFGGRQLGSDQLATFDREAARLLSEAGEPVLLL
ncbi:type II toxin-antitoxin system VapC family toxin [Cyanobium sp. ATX 6F1]|uniref:type II toxin-antitoxin system VapC family toxin n=1 Tax=unclassified Cyanobium TaxID=2627006 RepID=UPI0020CE75F1|nr:type II toxin-antitoxin system VapC family toxin [Cyanobium sp. ATX 6F1]MCP9915149.1 type II toxin-antitoxin system VapC family toxin [Cyanobium sp. ATX 6F1]